MRLVDERLGFRIFALQGFAKGEVIYRERIALEATHHVNPHGTRDAYERYLSLPKCRRDLLHSAFPALAAANDVDPGAADFSVGSIGAMLLGGRTVDVKITAEQHRRMGWTPASASWALARAWNGKKRATLDWFSRYAFRLDPTATLTEGRYQAGVYLLTGLINHRCQGFFNCRVVTDVGEIRLVAERGIVAGEEITINYGATRTFSCRGECCRR